MGDKKAIIWFRQDLRLRDNPALYHAAENGYQLIPIYIFDDKNPKNWKMGSASKLWLHHSLGNLNLQLGGNLAFYHGDPKEILPKVIKENDAEALYFNRCYEPWQHQLEKEITNILGNLVQNFNSFLLWEPWDVLKNDGSNYKVFTPFFKNGCLNAKIPREPLPIPQNLHFVKSLDAHIALKDLMLLPNLAWGEYLIRNWQIGEAAAQQKLANFLHNGLIGYKEYRNYPAKTQHTSNLSPHLHFGEISPHQIWYAAKSTQLSGVDFSLDLEQFLFELGWREFSYNLLYYYHDLPNQNLVQKFDNFPWNKIDLSSSAEEREILAKWQKGLTGYPIIDAGMRQLWQTGYMHNRVRMIVGSFLVKNLLLHWHHGRDWFWDCLVDADLANNSASWQWVAGCGADAAPYFRIFNPITQSERFDPEGLYIREYVPEIAKLPNKYLFFPASAPELILKEAGISLGNTYPMPIVDLNFSRKIALSAFEMLK